MSVANYQTHRIRVSDSSLYDEICMDCGAKDFTAGEDELSARPCTALIIDKIANGVPQKGVDHE
jgi:hypothetical protein